MVSRENKVIGGFAVVALALTYGGFWLTDFPSELLLGVLIFAGVIAPMIVNNRLDSRESA
ncbi:hypothetical protein HALLA_08780 [Halostagnicola larsenii XH-48]|uniref:Uncharacterized protein n=1 Tax=Halostagnicola larsenii XH-48 TaxID=797299 RepID=W0JUW4_9EURY|nr:hypothetical protein [Halostagnicola larsenii]AHG00813.1 hypothetical protein HALLA_08780 [Halostagnicola larsenii XH-48]